MNSQPCSTGDKWDRIIAEYNLNERTTLQHPETTQHTINITENDHIGTKIDETKAPETFRIYCGNINGLNLGRSGGDWIQYCEHKKRLSVDAVCLYEVNLDTQKSTVNSKYMIRVNLYLIIVA